MPNRNPVIPPSQKLRQMLAGEYTANVPMFPNVGQAIENFGNEYINPVSKFVNSLIAPIDPDSGLPNVDLAGKVFTGVKGTENALEILNKIIATKPKNVASAAVRYIKEKYPKLTGTFNNELFMDTSGRDFGNTLGEFFPSVNKAFVYPKTPERTMSEYAGTAAHETLHGYQWNYGNRRPEMVQWDEMAPKFSGKGYEQNVWNRGDQIGTYEPSRLSEKELDDLGIMNPAERAKMQAIQFQTYLNQPVEVEARKAGSTAEETFKKFIDKILPDPNENLFDLDSTEGLNKLRLSTTARDMQGIREFLRSQGYTGFKFQDKVLPTNTIEDVLGLPSSLNYWK